MTSRLGIPLASSLFAVTASIAMGQAPQMHATAVPIPGGTGGIGFDDLRYSNSLHRVLAPAGRTGTIALIEPGTLSVSTIPGFAASPSYGGGHGEGTTSVDEGAGYLFATDRTTGEVAAIDAATRNVAARAHLASGPDYVRWIQTTGEVWVTEPGKDRIEIFRLEKGNPPRLSHSAFLAVPGGPESLVVDPGRRRAYTHSWKGETMAIDVSSRRIASRWENGCAGSRGIALDSARGLLFAGCAEGKAVALNSETGKIISSISSGNGVDIIDFDPKLSHLYLPGARSATMAILGVSAKGALSLLATVATAPDAHCVTADGAGTAYVCDPKNGRILAIRDSYPPSRSSRP